MAVLEQAVQAQTITAVDDGWQDALQRRKQWTHEECLQLEQAGLLTEHYELLDGEIVFKMSQNMPHTSTVMRVLQALAAIFGIDSMLCQLPLMLGSKRLPEPDATVLAEPLEAYSDLPTGADARLVMEVSDATLQMDRNYKMRLYARAGIAEYWIVNISERVLEVYREPGENGYAHVIALAEADSVRPLAAPDAVVPVADLLP